MTLFSLIPRNTQKLLPHLQKTSFAVPNVWGEKDFSPKNKRDKILYGYQKYVSSYLRRDIDDIDGTRLPIILEKGKGQYLYDENLRKYIDFTSQNLNISCGHSIRDITEVACRQLLKLSNHHSDFYNEEIPKLAKKIIHKLPPHVDGEDWVVHFVNSSFEANNLAITMSKCVNKSHEIFTLKNSYHGFNQHNNVITSSFIRIDCQKGIEHLENVLTFGTFGKANSIIIEPAQLFNDLNPLSKNYMVEAFELLKDCGGVTIIDETMSGLGRTGKNFWAWRNDSFQKTVPDIITIGEGLGNGISTLAAVATRRSISEHYSASYNDPMYTSTRCTNPLSLVCANKVLDYIKYERLSENSENKGEYLQRSMLKLCKEYPEIFKGVRGMGLLRVLEINGDKEMAIHIKKKLLSLGIITDSCGLNGNLLKLQPPLCVEYKDIDNVTKSLKKIGENLLNELCIDGRNKWTKKINEVYEKGYGSF